MKIAALTLCLSLIPLSAHSADRPPFVGTYGINCAEDRQCALIIDQTKRGVFLAVWVVSARLDYNDVKCSVPLFMRDNEDGFLRAGLDGKVIEIERQEGGGVFVRGLAPYRCGIDLTGPYVAVGD